MLLGDGRLPMASDWERRGLLPKGLSVEQVEVTGERVLVHAFARSTAAACPQCGRLSRQVHSRYRRGLTDLPAHGREVKISLAVRRFRCRTSRCRTAIFAERFSSEVASPHARRTSRLQGLVLQLDLMLGGRPAQALAERLLLPVSKDTFLRSVRAASCFTPEQLRIIGIDNWAWRRGRRYGTLICDLERRRIVDILPAREPATVEAWLGRHPGIEIVARDPRWRLRPRRFPGSSERNAGRGPLASARQLREGLPGRGASFDARQPRPAASTPRRRCMTKRHRK